MAMEPKLGVFHQSEIYLVIKHQSLIIYYRHMLSVAPRTSPPLSTTRPQFRFYNMPISNFKLNRPLMFMH